MGDLAVAAGKLQLRQLANDDGVSRLNALEVVDALENQVQRVRRPLFSDITHGVDFGKNGFVKRLGERLPEQQGAQVVDLAAGEEAMAQVGASVYQHRESALLDPGSVIL